MNPVDTAEIYPSSSSWGTHRWSINSLEKAEEKFQALLNKDRTKKEEEETL